MGKPILNWLPGDEPEIRRCLAFMLETQQLIVDAVVVLRAAGVDSKGLPGTALNQLLKAAKRDYRVFPDRIRTEAWKRLELQIGRLTEDAKMLLDAKGKPLESQEEAIEKKRVAK